MILFREHEDDTVIKSQIKQFFKVINKKNIKTLHKTRLQTLFR